MSSAASLSMAYRRVRFSSSAQKMCHIPRVDACRKRCPRRVAHSPGLHVGSTTPGRERTGTRQPGSSRRSGQRTAPDLSFCTSSCELPVPTRTRLQSRPFHAFLKAALRAGHDRLIDLFCTCPDSLPAVEPAHPYVRRMRLVSPTADVCDGGGACTKDVICIGASERDEVCRQNLGHAAYASGDDEQPRTRSLDECNPKRLGQGRVQEDVPAYKYLPEGQPVPSSRKFRSLHHARRQVGRGRRARCGPAAGTSPSFEGCR
jgi:hypothetical protein